MVHRLAVPGDAKSAIGPAPMTATLRFRCACGNQELLTISAVFDASSDEERFIYTMRQMYRDMKFEISQHIKDQGGS